jgi:ankyrin repeat protein
VVKLLQRANADVNVQDKCGLTELGGAVKNRHTELVKLILDAKADINTQLKNGGTARS